MLLICVADVQSPWKLLEAFVLLLDLLRLFKWPFYTERAILMLSSLRALRMITLSEAMRALLVALASTFAPIASLLFVGELARFAVADYVQGLLSAVRSLLEDIESEVWMVILAEHHFDEAQHCSGMHLSASSHSIYMFGACAYALLSYEIYA